MNKTLKRVGLFVWLKLGEILKPALWITGVGLIVATFGYFITWLCGINIWEYVAMVLVFTLFAAVAVYILWEIYAAAADLLLPWVHRNWREVKRRIP